MTKQELIQLLVENKKIIIRFGVRRLGIFGSYVRDEATKKSDIDFFVDFFPEKKNFDNFIGLAFFLQDITGKKIEIVTPQSLSKYFGKNILKEVEYVPLAA